MRATSLDWTIVRPPRLTNRPNDKYRLARNAPPNKGSVASFRSVAAFMLDAAEQKSYVRELVGLAH